MLAANVSPETARRVTSVVRADRRTGHLIRTVIVSPRPVVARPAGGVEQIQGQRARLHELVEQAARTHDLDPALVHSIIKVESNYNPYAVSHKGAEGLMQLIPATARRLGVKNSFDPKENIDAGVRYYKYLKTLFGDDRLALAAYNAGEQAVAKYNFHVPPYPETVNYVYQVGRHWGEAARRRRAETVKVVASAPPEERPVPRHPRLEQFRDGQGRVYLRTVRE